MPAVRVDGATTLHYVVDDFTDPWLEPEVVLLHHSAARSVRMWYACLGLPLPDRA